MKATHAFFSVVCMLLCAGTDAQPGSPDITFVVHAEHGNGPLRPPYTVHVDFRISEEFPYSPSERGQLHYGIEQGERLQARGRNWKVHHVLDCWCTELRVRIVKDDVEMRLDMPDAPADRWKLVQRVMARSGDHPSPEVIRFRPGRFAFADVIDTANAERLSLRLAKRLEQARQERIRVQQEQHAAYAKAHPPAPPPPLPSPPPDPAREQARMDSLVATWGRLERVDVEQESYTRDSTVWVRITGSIMLDGACGGARPMFAIQHRTEDGWIDRVPMQEEQMCCGLPRTMLHDQRIGFDLAWWTRMHRPEGEKELRPGTYRLVFKGGDLEPMATPAFELH